MGIIHKNQINVILFNFWLIFVLLIRIERIIFFEKNTDNTV